MLINFTIITKSKIVKVVQFHKDEQINENGSFPLDELHSLGASHVLYLVLSRGATCTG